MSEHKLTAEELCALPYSGRSSRQENEFEQLMQDRVSIVKCSGERLEEVRASVSQKGVTTFDSRSFDGSFALEEGDVLLRSLPNELVERFVVEETGFSPGFEDQIPPHYSMKVRKETAIKKENSASIQNVFNVSHNARVNFHSIDESINTYGAESAVFLQLAQALNSQVQDLEEKAILLAKLEELKAAQQTPSFTTKFQEFMSLASNSMTVIGPFLPQLSLLLSS